MRRDARATCYEDEVEEREQENKKKKEEEEAKGIRREARRGAKESATLPRYGLGRGVHLHLLASLRGGSLPPVRSCREERIAGDYGKPPVPEPEADQRRVAVVPTHWQLTLAKRGPKTTRFVGFRGRVLISRTENKLDPPVVDAPVVALSHPCSNICGKMLHVADKRVYTLSFRMIEHDEISVQHPGS
ncbi:hypothetical protein X777_12711 [Ooceraea biroi]|uniref:Uncharacterized protein n=1 Tax=Ooceraea biroi TaxID=2015173 RepID=A0A026VYQ7_OOCBI|nr:hypothetical protein X777_12711 [Ooceraea biroi]